MYFKKHTIFLYLFLLVAFVFCKKENKNGVEETVTTGKLVVYVDETLLPIMEEQKQVFESQYPYAKITLVAKPEIEISKAIVEGKADFVILPRQLNENEKLVFKSKNIPGKITPFAKDAIAVLVNKAQGGESITTEGVFKALCGEETTQQLVFDNANSSTLNYLMEQAGIKKIGKTHIKALKNNIEVIKFVSENKNAIGFVGVNWLTNTDAETENLIKKCTVLALGKELKTAVKPTQTNIALDSYPFTRKIFLLNYQGKTGLGMGFASFVAGNVGQRIILKSGLLPHEIPTREIRIRKKI
jgi:phosphate transport system substrate-binding protein|nr:substrate-binding domain-containing protein [uncultured Flavobacterium sp.]